MPVPNWSALARSALGLLGDRLMRGLLALGAMTTGVSAPGWLKVHGEHWWEGAAPAEGTGPRAVIAAARTEPGALDDPCVLRNLRALRGSQDLPLLGEACDTYTDAAPYWHPERRPATGGG
jgi:hypothetical protein